MRRLASKQLARRLYTAKLLPRRLETPHTGGAPPPGRRASIAPGRHTRVCPYDGRCVTFIQRPSSRAARAAPPLRLTTPKCSRTRRPSYERRKGVRRALTVAALRWRIYRTDLQDGFGDVGRDCFWDAPLAAPHHTGDF